ncbi:phage holin family protein [Alloscardovia macacae]|nr:phage holin family protein [Alloscardovia macacae]
MKRFLMNWLVLTIATGVTVFLLPGLSIIGDRAWVAYGSFALFMALINASIKPFMQVLALPFSIFSFGLAALLINAACFEMASSLATRVFYTGVVSSSFGWSLMGALVLSLVSGLLGFLRLD